MWPIEAQRLRLVCSATSLAPSRIFAKSRLERPWPWVTMQKRWAPGRLGRLRVLEDLLGLHHRVHRRVRLGVAGLGAEAAVLGAAAGLGVDQRAHVGRVAEVLPPHLPGALDQLARSPRGRSARPRASASSNEISGSPFGRRLGSGPDVDSTDEQTAAGRDRGRLRPRGRGLRVRRRARRRHSGHAQRRGPRRRRREARRLAAGRGADRRRLRRRRRSPARSGR